MHRCSAGSFEPLTGILVPTPSVYSPGDGLSIELTLAGKGRGVLASYEPPTDGYRLAHHG